MMNDDHWSKATRDRWFYLALTVSAISVAWLFWPYLYVLLFSAVTVVVCWPAYQRVLKWTRGRALLASAVTTALLALLVFVPLAFVAWLFALEVQNVSAYLIDLVQSGELTVMIENSLEAIEVPPWMADFLPSMPQVGDGVEPVEGGVLSEAYAALTAGEGDVLSSIQNAALSALRYAGAELPGVVAAAVDLSVDSVIYVFAVITLFVQGPSVLEAIKRLSPMDDRYEEALFQVFGEFSRNLVVGSLATAGIQGIVAGLGYSIAGMGNVIFLAILTAVGSFVPVVGTVIIWVPVVLYLVFTGKIGMAVFLTIWCVVLVGSIDNILKPLFMRGSTNIHALLVFLAVFGGMYWMGLSGILIGPVLVAFFLALYTIYVRDFLGEALPVPEPRKPGWLERVFFRQLARYGLIEAQDLPEGVQTKTQDAFDAPAVAEPSATHPDAPDT